MVAITRWVQYDVSAGGLAGNGDNDCKGTRGYSKATGNVGDTFTIGSATSRLHLSIGGVSAPYITLTSGSNLDPRFVAKDITEKLHALSKGTEDYDKAQCVWENDGANGNHFTIYPGELGAGSLVVVATSGTNTAHAVLGWDSKDESGGAASSNTFNGTASVSGTYYGLFSEIYKVVISNDEDETRGIAGPSKDPGNSYGGTITTGGAFNHSGDITYTISIDCTNGTTMGQGTGNVPTMSWTSGGACYDSAVSTELLYPDHWYYVGSKGLMVKFTDAVFNTASPAWTIACYKPDYASGSNTSDFVGSAEYIWSSDRGDMSSTPLTTTSGGYTRLGSRGLYIQFNPTGGADKLAAGDEFYVICTGPAPSNYGISAINYGNVTVSTESPVKPVMFEIKSGAVTMSTVKFGLQNHGTFSHHDTGNDDTYFRFGTVGAGNSAGNAPTDGIEWYPNITAADIDSDIAPSYLYSTDDNLPVVATADLSKVVGNEGLVADPVWLGIRLGASETGANNTINYRLYFDYS